MTPDSKFPQSLPSLFFQRVSHYDSRDALYFKQKSTQQILKLTWKEWGRAVLQTASGLSALGIGTGDRVGILSENRPEWVIADLAVLSLGAVTVPIYPTSSPKEVLYILQDAGINLLFLSSEDHLIRLTEILPKAIKVVLFNPVESGKFPFEVLDLQGVQARAAGGDETKQMFLDAQLMKISRDSLATLIYTSGTTGPPKGVMLTHGNFIANYEGARDVIKVGESDLALSFLPLSHVFERLAGYYFMMLNGAGIAYAESMKTVPEDMKIFKPTVVASVPRLYEKMYAAIMEAVSKASPLRRKLFYWAIAVGKKRLEKGAAECGLWKLKYALARLLVLKKIEAKLGGRMRFFISGGAPLSRELAEFFYAAGILILEGYGLTETSPVIAVNSEKDLKFGTVGKPLANLRVKIAEDGEILTQGPCVMKGYYRNDAATQEALQGGWFHTGDIGELDAEGYLKITDRKKDIIVTSGGKNVSPQNIENLILADPLFLNVVVLGDKKNYLVALVALNRALAESLAKDAGMAWSSWAELLASENFYRLVEARIHEKTCELARYEQIKYFSFMDRELSQESGELTPTLKVKRKVIMEKFRDTIEALYRKGEEFKAPENPS